MKLDKKMIGIRIMQRRKTYGYTQEQLSEYVGLSKNHISSVERGVSVPTTQFIFKICDILGETPDYYLIGKTSIETDKLSDILKSLPTGAQRIIYKLIETYAENLDEI